MGGTYSKKLYFEYSFLKTGSFCNSFGHTCELHNNSFYPLHTTTMTNDGTVRSFRTVEILGLKGEKIGTLQFEPQTTQIQMMLLGGQLIMKLEAHNVQVRNRRGIGGSYADEYGIQRCENCNQKVALRKFSFVKSLVTGGIKLREHAVKNNTQTVMLSDVANRMTKTEYCNVNHLVRFGLAYKNDTMHAGEYGIPRKRRQQFINGERTVAEGFTEDPTIIEDTGEKRRIMSENRITIDQVKNIQEVKNMNGGFFTSYTRNEQFE